MMTMRPWCELRRSECGVQIGEDEMRGRRNMLVAFDVIKI